MPLDIRELKEEEDIGLFGKLAIAAVFILLVYVWYRDRKAAKAVQTIDTSATTKLDLLIAEAQSGA